MVLDGFAPSKNPSMWQADLFRALANLSKPGTTLATFTAAAVVKQGLQAAGFAWQNSAVLPQARYVNGGVFTFSRYFPSKLKRPTANHAHAHQHNNWHITQAKPVKGKRVLVIGGGMAGCHSAFALAARGFNVTLAEAKTLAAGGRVMPRALSTQRFLIRRGLLPILIWRRFYLPVALSAAQFICANGCVGFI